MVKINDFWIELKGQGQFYQGESENRGIETLGSIFRAPGPKNLKKGQNFNVIISIFLLR